LVFGVGPRSLVTWTTHPPKNNETLITTFVLFYAVFVVQRFKLFVFISLGEWAFCSCIFFSVYKIISGINIFHFHATIYFVPKPLLGKLVVLNTCIFLSANLSHPLRPNCVQSRGRKKIQNKPNLFPLLIFKRKVGMDPLFWTQVNVMYIYIHTYICMQFHLQ
jgi:hypothetical protein